MNEVRPYTPERLAERWECSAEHVRRLLATGRLHGFKLGGKLWRISAGEVERYECQQTIGSESSRGDGAPSGTKTEGASDGVLLQRHRLKRGLRSETLPENVTRLHGQRND